MAKLPTEKHMAKSNSHTLPPSPTHSSSSSDFEFTISISPRKFPSAALCPADDLFRDGHLLPLHQPSHRFPAMAPSTAARDSSGSSNDSQHSLFTATDCDSSRPSSVTDDDDVKRFHNPLFFPQSTRFFQSHREINKINKTNVTNKYLSSTFSRFSSVFRKEPGKTRDPDNVSGSSVRRVSATAREVVRKYLKKVRPLYEKFSQKQQNQHQHRTEAGAKPTSFSSLLARTERSTVKEGAEKKQQTGSVMLSHSFSGNLRHLRRKKSFVLSCPSSMRSSPTHSGAISRSGGVAGGMYYGSYNASTMEELQSAIQGAIAHCKNSWIQDKPMVSSEI